VTKESSCLKVPKVEGQKIIVLADKLELRDRALEVQKQADSICVPLCRVPTEKELDVFKNAVPTVQVEVRVFQELTKQEKTLDGVLAGLLPPHLLANLPKALDVVGDVAIVEIPAELKPHQKLVGDAVLATHRNVKTVLAKAGAVSGMYRTREFTVIAGEPRTRTVHREFGCQYEVDVAKAYFSPRLSHEHERVASLVQDSETVVDLFAGVGPFSVLIGKRHQTAKVYALDINPDAYELLKKNVLLNRVQGNVFPILGDARQSVHGKLAGTADRVIMNLPETASEFIDIASEAIQPDGGVVHFYGFVRLPDTVDDLKTLFAAEVEKAGRRVARFLSARAVRETAPYEQQIVLDAHVV
jgi:tRNA (guanine37-N1)-methyltransferase